MKVVVIVVTYNGMKWYDRCFGSLRRSTIPLNVLAIDNNSSDDSARYIREKFPEVEMMEQHSNLGFARANNLGLRYALDQGADYVFLLNQDAWLVQPDVIEQLIRVSEGKPEYAVICPLQLYGNCSVIVSEARQYASKKKTDDWISDSYFGRLKDSYETQYVCAASWLLPIETVKKIGGFDPLFFHYGEDDNYLQRVHYHGFKVGLCPKVNVCHDIEFHDDGYTGDNLTWRKYLLINYCNVNLQLDMTSLLRSKKRSIIVQLLRMNRKLLKESVPEYKYLREHKSEIEYSRGCNGKEGTNWL